MIIYNSDSKKLLRVLHVIGSMNLGGAETMIMNIYRKIDRSRIQFDFLIHTNYESAYEKEIIELGGRIFRIKKFAGWDLIRYYSECCTFFSYHSEISVVHGHIGSSAALYLRAAKKHGCFTIAHSHNALKINSLHDFLYYAFSYPTRFIADYFFGCSTEAGLARYGKKIVTSKKYSNFNNGIDVHKFALCKEKRDKIKAEFNAMHDVIIGTVGRLTTQKNPEKTLDIFKKIIQTDDRAVCIWVGTGELWNQIHAQILKENLSGRIIMTGARTDIPDILQAFDAFLFPSLWEGLPVSIIEAQAAGLPCILSDAISKEVELTSLIEWMNINEASEIWAKKCLAAAKSILESGRTCPSKEIIAGGYDINHTAEWLQKFYLKQAKEKSK